MAQYFVIQFETACDEAKLIQAGGWFETDYQSLLYEDIADVCEYFDDEDSAYKAWFRHYSGTEFQYADWRDEPAWECLFYALCKRVDGTEDESEIVEVSCGCLTLEDMEA